jgi:hypothetical protein
VVGEWPIPTAATLPLCSQTPNPSVVRYMEAGAFSVAIVNSCAGYFLFGGIY